MKAITYPRPYSVDPEFAGTLLGFDDYVSEWNFSNLHNLAKDTDMVLEDVTEL